MQASVPLWLYVVSLTVGPAVGGIIALLGAFGGPWIKARTDVDQWRRDKRLDAYAELYRAAYEFTLTVEKDNVEDDDVLEALDQVIRAESRVRLLGPESVRKAAHNLIRPMVAMAEAPNEPNKHADALPTLYKTFAAAASRALGVD